MQEKARIEAEEETAALLAARDNEADESDEEEEEEEEGDDEEMEDLTKKANRTTPKVNDQRSRNRRKASRHRSTTPKISHFICL